MKDVEKIKSPSTTHDDNRFAQMSAYVKELPLPS
jgi:hypothetical protein